MPDAIVIPKGYISLADTLKILQQSDSTVERLVRNQRLRSKFLPRPGKKAERIYLKEDVDKVALERETRRDLRPPSEVAKTKEGGAVVKREPQSLVLNADGFLREWMAALKNPQVELKDKLWLSLEESAEYSGLSKKDLRHLCRDGKLRARKSGGWKIRRASLEAFEE